jgi:hypothetical protein
MAIAEGVTPTETFATGATEADVGGVTVIVAEPATPPTVAAIEEDPAATPVTAPSDVTTADAVFWLDH